PPASALFPTRRSSDLLLRRRRRRLGARRWRGRRLRGLDGGRLALEWLDQRERRLGGRRLARRSRLIPLALLFLPRRFAPGQVLPDRKSTRLNSSHDQI